jgi:hypothetical protein
MAVERAEPCGDKRENRKMLSGSWADARSAQSKPAERSKIFLFISKMLYFAWSRVYLLVLERELELLEEPEERLLLLLLLPLLLLPLLLLYELLLLPPAGVVLRLFELLLLLLLPLEEEEEVLCRLLLEVLVDRLVVPLELVEVELLRV